MFFYCPEHGDKTVSENISPVPWQCLLFTQGCGDDERTHFAVPVKEVDLYLKTAKKECRLYGKSPGYDMYPQYWAHIIKRGIAFFD